MLIWSTEVISGELCLRLLVRWALICLFVAVSCAFVCDSAQKRFSTPIQTRVPLFVRRHAGNLGGCSSFLGRFGNLYSPLVPWPALAFRCALLALICSNLASVFILCILQIVQTVARDCCVFSRLLVIHVLFSSSTG